MLRQRFLLCFFFMLTLCWQAQAQLSKDAIPYSYKHKLSSLTECLRLVSFDVQSLKKEDEQFELQSLKPKRFAKMLQVELSPENSGTWDQTEDGRVWRLALTSPNAYSLYEVFGKFQLLGETKLFVYTPGYRDLKGAFTKKNNNIHHVLAVAPVPSDTIIIELNVPNEQSGYGNLLLTEVGHDYQNEFGKKILKNGLEQQPNGNCYVDINCPLGSDWQSEKKAVCKILVGGWLCTGTMVGNTKEQQIPYFLTANHCVTDSSTVSGSIIYFNYEKPTCNSTASISAQTLAGASIISTTDIKLDFLLLKLDNLPPVSFHPYFAGWDHSNAQPQSGTTIHQPNGSIKKISFDYSPLQNASYSFTSETGNKTYNPDSYWEVLHYDVGATENGSSGAPVFDSHHRVVGTLTGGPASCSSPNEDYYTRFAASWDEYSNPENQLKSWLDPNNSGVSALDGYDPYGFDTANCDIVWKVGAKEFLDNHSSFSWSGDYNIINQSAIAEKFNVPSWLDIYGVYFNVDNVHLSQPLSVATVKVWTGDTLPTTEVYSQEVFLKSIFPNAINFVLFDSVIKVSGNFFIGYKLSPSDSLVMYHAQNRGVNGPSTAYVYNGNWQPIDAVTSPAMYTSLSIGLTECYGKIQVPKSQPIKIYPNPTRDYLVVEPAEGVSLTGLQCFDMMGKPQPIHYDSLLGSITVKFDLHPGIYFIKVMTKSDTKVIRFIVVDNL